MSSAGEVDRLRCIERAGDPVVGPSDDELKGKVYCYLLPNRWQFYFLAGVLVDSLAAI